MIRAGFETTESTDSDSNCTGQGRGGYCWTWVGPRGALSGGCSSSKSRSRPRDLGRDVRDPRWNGRLSVGGRAAVVEERRERSHAGRRSARPPAERGADEMVYRQTNDFGATTPDAVTELLGVLATLNGLAREGRVGKRGLPKNPLQFVATGRIYTKHGVCSAAVPIPIQKGLAATFGRLAEALGYRGVYDRYRALGRIDVTPNQRNWASPAPPNRPPSGRPPPRSELLSHVAYVGNESDSARRASRSERVTRTQRNLSVFRLSRTSCASGASYGCWGRSAK